MLCPGYNDGDVLKHTLNDLFGLRPECRSVAVVPVGLTAHRQGLAEIQPTTAESASAAIKLTLPPLMLPLHSPPSVSSLPVRFPPLLPSAPLFSPETAAHLRISASLNY